MPRRTDGYRVCEDCGSLYLNFCLHCKKAGLDERVWEIMERYELNEDELIRILASQVKDGNMPALSLAIKLRDLMPADKSEVNVVDPSIREAKDRLGNLLERMVRGSRRPKSE